MSIRTAASRRWAAATVWSLGAVWLLTMSVLVLRLIDLGLSQWPLSYEGTTAAEHEMQRLGQQQDAVMLRLAGVAVVGAAVIAVAAFAGRLVRTGKIFVTLALVLGVLSIPVLYNRTDDTQRSDSPGPSACQERSGGDTRCPGG